MGRHLDGDTYSSDRRPQDIHTRSEVGADQETCCERKKKTEKKHSEEKRHEVDSEIQIQKAAGGQSGPSSVLPISLQLHRSSIILFP
jgi:hypothetical protein